MISYIEGRILEAGDGSVTVVTGGGVGYDVAVPSHTCAGLNPGDQIALYTVLLVREDMLRLCGFATREERSTFKVLVTIPKVGPKLALAVLSLYRPADLRRIIAAGDTAPLTLVPGIGKRTADTAMTELSYKLKIEASADLAPVATEIPGAVYRQVMDGLRSLGYNDAECSGAVQDVLRAQPDLDVTGALRAVLKQLARGRKG